MAEQLVTNIPDVITQQEIKDIQSSNAWPIDEIIDHKPKDKTITGHTELLIKWEETLWANDGSNAEKIMRQQLQIQQEKGRVEWVDTIGREEEEQDYTHVAWKLSWIKLSEIWIQCSRDPGYNKLKMYCNNNALDYEQVKKHGYKKI